MGYYVTITTLFETKHIKRDIFGDDLFNIEEIITEKQEFLNKCKMNLFALTLIDKSLLTKDDEDIIFIIRQRFEEELEILEDTIREITILEDIQSMLNENQVAVYDELYDEYWVKDERTERFNKVSESEFNKYITKMKEEI